MRAKNSLKTLSDLWFISILSRIALRSRLTIHQTAYAKLRPPRRRVTREQNVVELNSKLPMRDERNKHTKFRRKKPTLDPSPWRNVGALRSYSTARKKRMKSLRRRPRRAAQTHASAEKQLSTKI